MAANIRFATEADIPVILEFIHALAAYENMEDQVIVTPELLKEWVFQKKKAEVFLVSEDEKPVGFALFFTISPRGLAARAFILRTFSCCRNIAARATASCC